LTHTAGLTYHIIIWLYYFSACCLLFLIEQKTYAFSSSSVTQPGSASGADSASDAFVQVQLPAELEEEFLNLIRKETSGTAAIGNVSQRLNARKLTVLL